MISKDLILPDCYIFVQQYRNWLKMQGNTLNPRPQSRRIRNSAYNQGPKTGRQQAKIFFNKAKTFEASQKYLESLDNYLKATICDSSYFEAYCNMGACYRALGKYSEAKNCYLRAISLNKQDAISHYNLANLHRVIGDYDSAVFHYQFVINLQQKQHKQLGNLYIDSLVNTGICYKNQGFLEEAINVYQKATKIKKQDEACLYNHAMCLIALIEACPTRSLQALNNERAEKAQKLLQQVKSINPNNKMVPLAKLKINILVATTEQQCSALEKKISQMCSNYQDNSFDYELNQLKDLCAIKSRQLQKRVQDIQKGRYQLSRPSSVNTNIENNNRIQLFSSFENLPQGNENKRNTAISQEDAIKLIKNHNYKEVEDRLKSVDDNDIMKQILKMMIYISKSEFNVKYMQKAYQIYQKCFTGSPTHKSKSFQNLSEQAHKAIGQVLNYKKKYSESAQHFQYVSRKLMQRKESIASDHNILAEGLQQAGNLQKAIEEYRKAFELEPANENMCYNLGQCLFQNGHFKQAIKYINLFLQLIEKNATLDETEKEVYRAECSIIKALSSEDQSNEYELYQQAYDKLMTFKDRDIDIQLEQQHMLVFYLCLSEHLERRYSTLQKNTKEHKKISAQLAEVYETLLAFKSYPQRPQIFLNAGNFSYEKRNYLKAASFFQEIPSSVISNLKLALCYLHLFQPPMVLKHIEQAQKLKLSDPLNQVFKCITDWIYFNQKQGRYSEHLPRCRDDLFYARNIFGITILEYIEHTLKGTELDDQGKSKTILNCLNQLENLPLQKNALMIFNKVKAWLAQSPIECKNIGYLIPVPIVMTCFSKSEAVREDFEKIISFLLQMPQCGVETQIMEALIFIFIYCNHGKHILTDLIRNKVKTKKHTLEVNLDKVVETDQTTYCIMPDFTSAKKLVTLLQQWQQVLTPNIQSILGVIQEHYYKGQVKEPLQLVYNFPRHTHFMQSQHTFSKLTHILHQFVTFEKRITGNGRNIIQMKKNLISNYEEYFKEYLKRAKLSPLSLGKNLTPLTIYTNHSKKAETEEFISSLLGSSTLARFHSVDCDEYEVIFNKLIKLRCRWRDPLDNKTRLLEVFESIVESPLDIVNQAVLALQTLIPVIRKYSKEGAYYFLLDSTLNIP